MNSAFRAVPLPRPRTVACWGEGGAGKGRGPLLVGEELTAVGEEHHTRSPQVHI